MHPSPYVPDGRADEARRIPGYAKQSAGLRSFTARFTFLYVAIAAALLVAFSVASTITAVMTYVAMLNMTVRPAAERSIVRMKDDLARGATFGDAAASVVRDFDHPLMHVIVYDAHHRAVAGSVQPENRVAAAFAVIGGLRSAEGAVPGGSLVVSADASTFGRRLVGFWARTVSFGLIAIGLAFVLGRAVTRRAMVPVTRVTAALRSFADGDLVPHAIMASGDAEFAALADAHRDAIVRTQHAFAAREQAQYASGAPIKVGVEARGARLFIDVVDLGPGMCPDDRAHAFDRFYRGSTRGVTQGSGLGLAIAKRAVDRMGGTITLSSEPGRGTRVTLSLPRRMTTPSAAGATRQAVS
ncbi:MAG: sensor histidine kinase [Candidatus Eremiobacteraeota bacterium]|nr:sensor histidine kinase [Candidatus Eremiobacteraeota bacterium]